MELDWVAVDRIIDAALAEDIGTGDITSHLTVPGDAVRRLSFVNREPLVVCGTQVVERVCRKCDPTVQVTIHVQDGKKVRESTSLIAVEGNARALLAAERTALNLFQRMCGVATLTRAYVEAIVGTKAEILDTRKTMPGLRVLDKYATRTGGARNHRIRLDDAILIKDNHIAFCGGVAKAVTTARAHAPKGMRVEVECDTIAQLLEALEAGAEAILLDNMPLASLREAVVLAKGKATLEASGNATLHTVRAIAETGVDFISVGRITHSAPAVDVGLDVLP